jgi:hypothetical protein
MLAQASEPRAAAADSKCIRFCVLAEHCTSRVARTLYLLPGRSRLPTQGE